MPVEIKKDGRTILKGQSYTDFRRDLYNQQQGRCIKCGKETSLVVPLEWSFAFHVAHRGSRGMGSAIRDDVVGPKRGQVEGGKCKSCHMKDDHNQS